MNRSQMTVILSLLAVSVLILFVPAVVAFVRRLVKGLRGDVRKRTSILHKIDFLLRLLVAVCCLRYAVGYFGVITQAEGALTWWEEIFNSFTHALQTFSMDEEYTDYILDGKDMICAVFNAIGEPLLPFESTAETVYGLYVSFLNLLAPVVGGALVFELLTNIFPWLKLRMSYVVSWRAKYYFSELNEMSLELAKSLCASQKSFWKKPYIIFTDAYVDDENEKSSEMLLEAKWIGAICVRDDLAHIEKCRRGSRAFFLVDENGASNLQTLTVLADADNYKYLRNAEIHFFTTDDAYVQIEKGIRDRLSQRFSEKEMPIFTPVHCYRNLILNLLQKIPLYDPLVGRKGAKELTVTVLGTGCIGTEMFLTTYWLGQMLDCHLKINVLSQESEEAFRSKIDYVNPEIRYTMQENHPVLTVNRKGETAPVYCKVEYIQCDVKSSTFVQCLTDGERGILDTDYFLVALGSDEDNISVANTVRKYVGQHHLSAGDARKTVIAYVVYDSELSDLLNANRYFCFAGKEPDVYMCAIGSLREVYHVDNVLMEKYRPLADQAHAAYLSVPGKRYRAMLDGKRRKEGHYNYHSSLARAMHIPYKMFSVGLVRTSVFDCRISDEERTRRLEAGYKTYQKFALGEERLPCASQTSEHLALLNKLAWLEHRRWNAWTRVYGFRSTKDYVSYASAVGSYKQTELLLHPCLLECDAKGIRAKMTPEGAIVPDTILRQRQGEDYDLLDELSYDLYARGYNGYDFKMYDYPRYDFS